MSWSPEARQAAAERMRERHRLGVIAQSIGPEVRARMSAARMEWCPPELRELYGELRRKVGAADARAAVLKSTKQGREPRH